MNFNRLKTLFLLLTLGSLPLFASDPFPIGFIDQETLNLYAPKIYEVLEGELAHQNDGRTNRLTKEFGYSFFKMERGDFTYTAPPPFLQELGYKVCEALDHPPKDFTNFIISLYEEGYILEPHVDVACSDPYHGFYFDERVYGVILEIDPEGHLYFIKHEGNEPAPLDGRPVYSLNEIPGMVFSLEGELRNAPYHHAVSRVANRRVSLTFRVVHLVEESKEN